MNTLELLIKCYELEMGSFSAKRSRRNTQTGYSLAINAAIVSAAYTFMFHQIEGNFRLMNNINEYFFFIPSIIGIVSVSFWLIRQRDFNAHKKIHKDFIMIIENAIKSNPVIFNGTSIALTPDYSKLRNYAWTEYFPPILFLTIYIGMAYYVSSLSSWCYF